MEDRSGGVRWRFAASVVDFTGGFKEMYTSDSSCLCFTKARVERDNVSLVECSFCR